MEVSIEDVDVEAVFVAVARATEDTRTTEAKISTVDEVSAEADVAVTGEVCIDYRSSYKGGAGNFNVADRDRGGHRGNYGNFGEDHTWNNRGGGPGVNRNAGFSGNRRGQDRRPYNEDMPNPPAGMCSLISSLIFVCKFFCCFLYYQIISADFKPFFHITINTKAINIFDGIGLSIKHLINEKGPQTLPCGIPLLIMTGYSKTVKISI